MPLDNDDLRVLQSLRDQARAALADALGELPSPVILVGTPRHRNLGDTFIWDGQRRLLEELGHRIISDSFRAPHDLIEDVPAAQIVVAGGGNLGDLYPVEENGRRDLVDRHPGRRIVFLPQTARFVSATELARSHQVYRRAEALVVLVRDSRSERWAATHMPDVDVRFCPDLAFGMHRLDLDRPEGRDRPLTVARADDEATLEDRAVTAPDWVFSRANAARWQLALAPHRLGGRMPIAMPARVLAWGQRHLRQANLAAARQMFSGVSAVATNRLHVHVFCAVHGIPHFVADNSYGKIRSIFQDYSGAFSSARWCDSLSEAIARAERYDTPRAVCRRTP